jgi:dipeptidyl aminopeptidase/acylaminoacyl peptidase
MKCVATLFLSALATCVAANPPPAPRRALSVDDYYDLQIATDVRISPDGTLAAFVVSKPNRVIDKVVGQIYLVRTNGGEAPRPLTYAPQSASHPSWSPDGRTIAFLATRPSVKDGSLGKPQVQILSLDGGEARAVTDLKNGVGDFRWSPDGSKLACVSSSNETDDAVATPDSREQTDIRRYTHALYRLNGRGDFESLHDHIFVVELASERVEQLTRGAGWADSDPQWSPDGKRIAFVSDRSGSYFDASHPQTKIWSIAASGDDAREVSIQEGTYQSPRWSADGKEIAFIGSEKEDGPNTVWVGPGDGGRARAVVKDIDGATHNFVWQRHTFYFLALDRGTEQGFAASSSTGKVTKLTSADWFITTFDINARGEVAFIANDFSQPPDVYAASRNFARIRQLTQLNRYLLNRVELATLDRLSYTATDGLALEGFLAKPYGWKTQGQYPMILMVHGGPNEMSGNLWLLHAQELAAQGFAIFLPNFRGSSGYGHAFQRAIAREWGGSAYTDIVSGVDAAINRNSWVDPDRLGVWGLSFGGYMTNWIIAHSRRFKAAVTESSISNLVSLEGTRDAFYGHAHDFGGDLLQDFAPYWEYSPLRCARYVSTPTLIVHGEADYRVPVEQAAQWFRALRYFNVPTEMVILPREPHTGAINGEPKHVVAVQQWTHYWFHKYLDRVDSAPTPDTLMPKAPDNSSTCPNVGQR